ncbi:torso-like protein [Schistocerca gregaria]|uniref:torso-like protein n=1 Tax=Schistocerca gregaria TaxID=7010 RepID=UPI00211F131A|nr:torso-like protein [Schistocerca gregaria]XP_049836693.1 torso-like protein [Schistocerca gregaria]XP_049836694.1 torso-like protein [Schistocerca gregaria]
MPPPRLRPRAPCLLLAAALLLARAAPAPAAAAAAAPASAAPPQNTLRLGAGVNVFSRYGYLSISMRVVPRNDSDGGWLFREPTVDVFTPGSLAAAPLAAGRGPQPVFQGDFHMEFCDNLKQLMQAYFRDFSVERLERPWRAFSGGWSRASLSRHLGIASTFASGAAQHCYVLVRVARHRRRAALAQGAPLTLLDAVRHEADKVVPGDTASVVNFVRSFGSHYVAAYVTGNSLYQVFVFTPQIYRRIKQLLKTQGVSDFSNEELSNYFSPWYAEHIGAIQSASGNATVEAWAADNLRQHFYFLAYSSLLKLHGNAPLLRRLDGLLREEALLQLDLRTLAPAFQDAARRQWFLEVVDNYLKLWEVNM